jgi:hypothetical protein
VTAAVSLPPTAEGDNDVRREQRAKASTEDQSGCARQSATGRTRGAGCANMRALRAGSSFISDFPALASSEGFFLETVARSGFELYRVYTCAQTACGALLLFKHHRQRPEPGFGDRERVSAPMLPLIRGCHASIPDLRRHE